MRKLNATARAASFRRAKPEDARLREAEHTRRSRDVGAAGVRGQGSPRVGSGSACAILAAPICLVAGSRERMLEGACRLLGFILIVPYREATGHH